MNRSGLVTALTLIKSQGLSGRAAIELVKRNRRWGEDGYQPLSNPQFVQMLSRVPGRSLPEPEPLEVCFEVSWR
jgi:protein-tyrosine phosphatase